MKKSLPGLFVLLFSLVLFFLLAEGLLRFLSGGFRLPDPATEAKRTPGDRVVIALGDSVTFGWGTCPTAGAGGPAS